MHRLFRTACAAILSTALAACGGGGGGGGSSPPALTVGGTVSGLAPGAQLVLLNNGSGATTVTANGAFTLSGTLAAGASYAVTVGTQPAGQNCTVSAGSGANLAASVTGVSVSCLSIGRFIDAPVAGLAYTCSSPGGSPAARSGTTDAQGQFEFAVGQGCTFKVGNVTVGTVGSVPADNIVTPQDLAGVIRSATSSPAVLAIAQFLQSLNDGSAAGTLTIPASATTALNGVAATTLFSNASGVLSQPALLALVRAAGQQSLVSPAAASSQLQQELNSGRVKATSGAVTASSPVTLSSIVIGGEASVAAGLRGTLTATGHYSDGSTKDLTASATWSSTRASVATVSAGSVLGVAPGSATVTAQAAGVTGTASVQVGPPVLQSLALSPASPSVVAGRSTTLVLTGTYSDGSKGTAPGNVNWSSSAPATASVDATGKVTGAATGSATITASIGSLNTSLHVNVLEPEITSIVISAVSNAVQVGSTLVLNALANLSNDTQKSVTALVTWVVKLVTGGTGGDAAAVATVTTSPAAGGTATLTAVGLGSVAVTANYQGVTSASVSIEVSGPFAFAALELPDLEPLYQQIRCPATMARGLQHVIPIDLNGDKRQDLLVFLWCSPVSVAGTYFDGPTPNRLVALLQNPQGRFEVRTQEVFGTDFPDIGGASDCYVVHDFNGDGRPDIVFSVKREDGRQASPPTEINSARTAAMMSRPDGTYGLEFIGEPQWGECVFLLDNAQGGKDFFLSGRGNSQWTYRNGWVRVQDMSFLAANVGVMFFDRVQPGTPSVRLITALNGNAQIFGLYLHRWVDGAWVPNWQDGYRMPLQEIRKAGTGGVSLEAVMASVDGKDYVDPAFGAVCQIRRTPGSPPQAIVAFNGTEIVGGYKGQVVDTNGPPIFQLKAFGIDAAGKLAPVDLKIRNEKTRDTTPNRMVCQDINGDGYDDIVLFASTYRCPAGLCGREVLVYLNDGQGDFSLVDPRVFPEAPPEFADLRNYVFADVNGDGIPDLVYFPIVGVAGQPNRLRVHMGLRPMQSRDLK